MQQQTLYIKADQSIAIETTKVRIKDIGSVYSHDPDIVHNVEEITLFSFHKEMDGRQVISILKVIELIQKLYPDIHVVNLGYPEVVVFHKKPAPITKKTRIVQYGKIFFVCIISFFGAAFTIMTYNNDVGVNDLFSYLYSLFMGYPPEGNTVLQLGYAIGLAIGLLFFFNHVARHRLSDEPTPLEVEMRLYERDVNDATAISSGRNKKTLDV